MLQRNEDSRLTTFYRTGTSTRHPKVRQESLNNFELVNWVMKKSTFGTTVFLLYIFLAMWTARGSKI